MRRTPQGICLRTAPHVENRKPMLWGCFVTLLCATLSSWFGSLGFPGISKVLMSWHCPGKPSRAPVLPGSLAEPSCALLRRFCRSGKPEACIYGLLSMNCGPLWGAEACCSRPLGFPGRLFGVPLVRVQDFGILCRRLVVPLCRILHDLGISCGSSGDEGGGPANGLRPNCFSVLCSCGAIASTLAST